MLISYIAKKQASANILVILSIILEIWSIKSYSEKLLAQGPDYRNLIYTNNAEELSQLINIHVSVSKVLKW